MDINEVLKLSKEMGVEIVDGNGGKHYIIDENGDRVEFNTNVLLNAKKGD